MNLPRLAPALLSLTLFSNARAEGEIGFLERFALAEDRAAAIKELVPGTEDFYYFSALHAQHEDRLAAVEELFEPWRQRFGETPRYLEIRNRQALLSYGDRPAETLAYLKDQLGLSFNHQQERLDAKPDFPTRLDPALVSREAFLQKALSRVELSGITDAGLDGLLRNPVELTPPQRRQLLSRLRYPDHEQLVGLIAADLRARESQGFGEFEIHRRLTLSQLDELAGLRPELAQDPRFVEQRLLRLQPGGDEVVHRNPAAERAWNDRVWAYVRALPPAFGSMKAAVLHRRLELARKRGEYPAEDFLDYLRLPRPMPYMRPAYLREQQLAGATVDLNIDHTATIGIPPIGGDEGLVREYLEHFFLTDETTNRFSPYLDEIWLERVFAETKLLNGIGDAQQWFSRLGPAQVQTLQDRVEIEFAPANPERFTAADEVVLTATLKNVPELIVKVYEINALNYYRERGDRDGGREINTDLDLDGLVANEETIHRYDDAPILRRTETFRFDSLTGKRGVWVVELIGNGISSRALVRKGELQALTRTTVGGELLTVIDEANDPVAKAAAWFGGRRYDADEKGLILLPFSEAGTVPVVLTDDDFASLAKIALPREDYQFTAGFLLEQETLLPGAEATVAVRPVLTLNGEPVSLSRLEDVHLTITTDDIDGIESISTAEDFALFDDRESTHAFRVPSRLRAVQVNLSAQIASVVKPGEKTQVSYYDLFEVNGVDLAEITADSHLGRFGEDHVVLVSGLSGEPLPDRAVTFGFVHREFAEPMEVTLKSDDRGRIDLGELPGIASITCRPAGLRQRTWKLAGDHISRFKGLHARTGETVEIPLPRDSIGREALAIFEVRAGTLVEDVFAAATFEPGMVRLEGLKAGDYEIVLKSEGQTLPLKITRAEGEQFGYALSADRHLQIRDPKPLRISSAVAKDGKLLVTLGNADRRTRLHLVATRFLPVFDPYSALDQVVLAPPYEIRRGGSSSRYVSGRDIGEEYRYILERRGAKKFPGNLLARPGLLLNPWALNETQTGVKEAAKGEAYRKSAESPESEREGGGSGVLSARRSIGKGLNRGPSLNFLARQAVVMTNLKPAEDGTVSVDLADLGDRQHVHLVAVNATDTVAHSFALPEPEGGAAIRDLRLDSTLDPTKHFTQRRKVTLLREGQTLIVSDFRASEVQPYDTIGDVYQTLLAVSGEGTPTEFGFVANWPSFDEARKRELYSEHACHELHFFLAQKDGPFFDAVVKPYLANKKDKTFLDRYLLGEALESFLAPWEFGRLNIVERILLARRIGEEERARTASHVTSLHQLLPPDPERDAFFYRRALRGRGADVEAAGVPEAAGFGFAEVSAGAVAAAPESPALRARGAARAMPAADPFADPATPALAAAAPMAAAAEPLAVSDEDLLQRAEEQALYQTLDSTKELAENNYRHLPIAAQNADLVTVNRFWRDYANWNGEGGFYSREFPAATSNFTEMMFALSVLDLPVAAEKHEIDVTDNVLKLTAASPTVVFHEEIEEAPLAEGGTPILVSQNFLRSDDRQREEDGQMVDKFVTGEMLTGTVYASQVVVTNPTSSVHRLDLLVQIPEGAVPVAGGDYTKSHPLNLAPFSTERIETKFYFPSPSDAEGFALYPVQVAKNEQVIAAGEARRLTVVEALSDLDEASWDYLSQFGTERQVLDYLTVNNLHRLDLARIAWRARESVDFLRQATGAVGSRHAYDATLWSYGLHHNDTAIAREYLKHREDFLARCGKALQSEFVSLDPVERHSYQHLDYTPLVNARSHRLGRDHRILNDRFRGQYGSFLQVLAQQPSLDAEDKLAVAAYLSLQDRIEEAIAWLDAVPEAEVVSRLQYDYLRAYHAFHREDLAPAKVITAAYADYPVDKWRKTFAEVAKQVAEVEGAEPRPAGPRPAGPRPAEPDKDTREGQIESLSSQEPFLDLSATGRELSLRHRNLKTVTVNYYEMDLEFLFSSRPFVSAGDGGFAFIRPNLVETKELPDGGAALTFPVPEPFASKNVLVEVTGGGRTSSVAVYSNRLDLRLTEGYGRLELRHEESGKPLVRAYVKVYARTQDGSTRFFKDGYTDLRGVFDYASLSTDELDRVERLSLLVMSEEDGSLVREAAPPQR